MMRSGSGANPIHAHPQPFASALGLAPFGLTPKIDDIPATLIPILHSQCQDQLPCIHQLMDKTRDWINKHSAEITLPRFIGKVDYQINGAEGKRLCTPYTQWMYERVLAPIHAAVEPQRAELIQWLSQQNIPFKLIQPKDSLVFQQSRLWRKAKL
jgi:hypothetical protein